MTAAPDPPAGRPPGGSGRTPPLGRLTILLLALGALLVVPPLLPMSPAGQAIFELIVSMVAVGAALEIGHGRALLVIAGTVATAATVTLTASLIWPEATVDRAVFELLIAVLFGLLIWKVGRDVARARIVTTDVLRGTIAIYLMLGISFGILYRVTNSLDPEAFTAPEVAQAGPSSPGGLRRNDRFRYYSFVTLTTLGYGDITPRSAPARTLSWLEAVVGQLFIAITVARLVALHVARHREEDGEE